jgi:hypothetical protein
MRNYILFGIGRFTFPVPIFLFKSLLGKEVDSTRQHVSRLSDDQHRVRDFAVKEIPNVGKPITPEFIGESLDLSRDKTVSILDELEKGMTYLWRGDGENVTWAYPVTVDETPYRYTFNTGETGNAA